MKRFVFCAALFTIYAASLRPVFGDTLDQAEAKRRGVPIEVVQLEREREKSDALQKRIGELEAENAKLKQDLAEAQAIAESTQKRLDKLRADMTPEQQKMVDEKRSQEDAIAKAVSEKRLVVGMSVDDLKKIGSLDENGVEGGNEVDAGGATMLFHPRLPGKTVYYRVRISGGKLVSFSPLGQAQGSETGIGITR